MVPRNLAYPTELSIVALDQVPLLMLEGITATRSQGPDDRSQDVRDAVRVARLPPSLGVKRAIFLLLLEGYPHRGNGGLSYKSLSYNYLAMP